MINEIRLRKLASLAVDPMYQEGLKVEIQDKQKNLINALLTFSPVNEDSEFKIITKYFYNLGRNDMAKDILKIIDDAPERLNTFLKNNK